MVQTVMFSFFPKVLDTEVNHRFRMWFQSPLRAGQSSPPQVPSTVQITEGLSQAPVGLWLGLQFTAKQVCSLWWDSNLGSIRHLTAVGMGSSGSWDAGHTQSLTKKSGLVFGIRPDLWPPPFTNEVEHNCILSCFNSIYFTLTLKWLIKEDPKS